MFDVDGEWDKRHKKRNKVLLVRTSNSRNILSLISFVEIN